MDEPKGEVKSKTQSQDDNNDDDDDDDDDNNNNNNTEAAKEEGQQVGDRSTTVSRANQTKPRGT